jgi:hypothetical protein
MYDTLAVNDIRKYLWDKIVASKLLNANDYRAEGIKGPLIPIIPAQQVPEFINLLPGKTIIIYEYNVFPTRVQWWLTEERAVFYINSQNYDLSNKLINLFHDLFRRFDESAADINAYLAGNTDFIFHHISIGSIESPLPFKSEGDLQEAVIQIEYTYSRKTEADGRF